VTSPASSTQYPESDEKTGDVKLILDLRTETPI